MILTNVTNQVSSLSALITAANSNVVVAPGSVFNDTFILPAAASNAWSYTLAAYNQMMYSLDLLEAAISDTDLIASLAEALNISTNQASAMITATIERFGNNFGVTRKAATAATGFVQIYTTTLPEADLPVSAGLGVETLNGLKFTTDATVTLPAADAASYWIASLGGYAISVKVTATFLGTTGNVLANSITIFSNGSGPGWTGGAYVTNLSDFTMGKDVESDSDLIVRIRTTIQGISNQTSAGMKALILNNLPLTDVLVADASSEYQIRNDGNGGVVDIYTYDVYPVVITETLTNIDPVFSKQPVLSILSATSNGTAIDSSNYTLLKEQDDRYSQSTQAHDSIGWLPTSGFDIPSSFEVSYIYNAIPSQIEDVLVDYKPLMGDIEYNVMGRMGEEILANINFQVTINSTNATTVKTNIVTNIQSYISDLGFGDELAASEVISIIQNTSGVVSVNTSPISFCVYNQETGTYGPNKEIITCIGNQYVRAQQIVIS